MIYESIYARLTERCADTDSTCWIGIDPADRFGYQQLDVYIPGLRDEASPVRNSGRRRLMAHVAAWCWLNWNCTCANDLWLAYREFRESGMELDHTCEEPGCRNPDHLEPLSFTEHRQVTLERRAARAEARGVVNYEPEPEEVEF